MPSGSVPLSILGEITLIIQSGELRTYCECRVSWDCFWGGIIMAPCTQYIGAGRGTDVIMSVLLSVSSRTTHYQKNIWREEEDPAHHVTNLKTQAKEKIKYKIEGFPGGSQTWNKPAVNECQKSVTFHNYTCSGSPTQTTLKTNISKTAREWAFSKVDCSNGGLQYSLMILSLYFILFNQHP